LNKQLPNIKNLKMKKVALITGITGQDGSYLAEYLLKKNYTIYGIRRRSSSFNLQRIAHLYKNVQDNKINLIYGDITDSGSIIDIIQKIKPDEIYNLAAQSHVRISFDAPEYTANTNALGALRILEAIRILKLNKKTKFYQASTSEIFGNSKNFPQNEKTNFAPESPYGISKLFAYWTVINYRKAYKIHASNGILFNHESPRRGEIFVTKKITRSVAAIKLGLQKKLILGNLNAVRDWGHAKDYVKAMYLMLQKKNSDDYVIATGKNMSVREFTKRAFKQVNINIVWKNKGLNEIGMDSITKKILIEVDKKYFRPTEVFKLKGNSNKAKIELKWQPEFTTNQLIKEMVQEDINLLQKK
jgi:GDPmannose 4,6-dehydratase